MTPQRIDTLPETVEEMMALAREATAPSSLDFYLGAWPSQEPMAVGTREITAEAESFIQEFEHRHPKSQHKDDWADVGEWLNETITKSRRVAERAARDKYWLGARKTLVLQRDEFLDVARANQDLRSRYEIMGTLNDDLIGRVEGRIRDRIAQARECELDWKTTGAVVGLVLPLALGIGGMVLRGASTLKVLCTAVSPALGGPSGYFAGDAARRWSYSTSRLTRDLSKLKALRERRGRLQREGVHIKTVEGVIDIMEDVHGQLRIETDPGRREWILEKAQRRMERLVEENGRKESSWSACEARIDGALHDQNPEAVGEVLVDLCDLGNQVRKRAVEASEGRLDRLLTGWARARFDPLEQDPDELWD